jgi:hypothetical protein
MIMSTHPKELLWSCSITMGEASCACVPQRDSIGLQICMLYIEGGRKGKFHLL